MRIMDLLMLGTENGLGDNRTNRPTDMPIFSRPEYEKHCSKTKQKDFLVQTLFPKLEHLRHKGS